MVSLNYERFEQASRCFFAQAAGVTSEIRLLV
jgi:hypothetical protein